ALAPAELAVQREGLHLLAEPLAPELDEEGVIASHGDRVAPPHDPLDLLPQVPRGHDVLLEKLAEPVLALERQPVAGHRAASARRPGLVPGDFSLPLGVDELLDGAQLALRDELAIHPHMLTESALKPIGKLFLTVHPAVVEPSKPLRVVEHVRPHDRRL